jgi:hypothetical protein
MAYRYKTVKRGGKTVLLHRHVAEQKLGRPLRADEHVHHGNEERWDNRPDNLEVLSAAEHHRIHSDGRLVHPRTKSCEVCGTNFTPHPTKRKRAKTCSEACANKLRGITEKATKASRPPMARAVVSANYSELQAVKTAA